MSEAAVIEQTEATPAPSPDEVVSTPGDAEPSAPADAGAAPETTVDTKAYEAEADAWLAEQAQKEGGEKPPEPEQPRGVDPAAVDAALTTFRNGYGSRQTRLDALEEALVDAGMPESVAKRFVKDSKDILNEHHADSLKYAGFEAAASEATAVLSSIRKVVSKPLYDQFIALANKGEITYEQMFKDAITEAEAKAEKRGKEAGRKEGFVAGRSHAEKVASGSQSGQRTEGTATNTRSFQNEDALHVAFGNKEISRDVYAAEYKRLTGKDL